MYPKLNNPVLIAGFEGWGNALDISSAMADFIIRQYRCKAFARLDPDEYYRYDDDRPKVRIENGYLRKLEMPKGEFYAPQEPTAGFAPVVLKAVEPGLRWIRFTEELLDLCHEMGIRTVITLGSMYDNVLHTDRILSGIATDEVVSGMFGELNIYPVEYSGPGAIHSIIQLEGEKRGFNAVNLWTHCPYYLEGITHYGLLSTLGSVLSVIGRFELDISELENHWSELNIKIQILIDENPKLQSMIKELKKAKNSQTRSLIRKSVYRNEKVINIRDFLEPK